MLTTCIRTLLHLLRRRIEARQGRTIDAERVMRDRLYASAVLALARATRPLDIRLLAALLRPLLQPAPGLAGLVPLHGCPPTTGQAPRRARVIAFPRPGFA